MTLTNNRLYLQLDNTTLWIDTSVKSSLQKAMDGSRIFIRLDSGKYKATSGKTPCFVICLEGKKHQIPKKRWKEMMELIERADQGEEVTFSHGIQVIASSMADD